MTRAWMARGAVLCAVVASCLPRGHVEPVESVETGRVRVVDLGSATFHGGASDGSETNAVVTVIAWRGLRAAKRWTGPVQWDGPRVTYAGKVSGRTIAWEGPAIDNLRLQIKTGRRGVLLAKWLPRGATRVMVTFVEDGGAGMDGAVDVGGTDPCGVVGAAGSEGDGGSGGRGRRGNRGARLGGSADGHRGGALAEQGGVPDARSPTPHGEAFGDAQGAAGGDGERGKYGVRGAIALFGGLLGVRGALRAAVETALIAAEVATPEALVSKASAKIAGKLGRESTAALAAQLRRELATEASKFARAEVKRLRPMFVAKFGREPAHKFKHRLAALYHFKQVQYFQLVEGVVRDRIWKRAVRVKPVAGRLPRNHAFAGEVLPVDAKKFPEAARIVREKRRRGVAFTKDGYPDFEPWVYKEGRVKADVEITYQGTRGNDFGKADRAMQDKLGDPSWKRPRGYTWHHHEREGRMLLVPSRLHEAVQHTGGIPHYKVRTGEYDAYQRVSVRRPSGRRVRR